MDLVPGLVQKKKSKKIRQVSEGFGKRVKIIPKKKDGYLHVIGKNFRG
jgi:hypothetical protein